MKQFGYQAAESRLATIMWWSQHSRNRTKGAVLSDDTTHSSIQNIYFNLLLLLLSSSLSIRLQACLPYYEKFIIGIYFDLSRYCISVVVSTRPSDTHHEWLVAGGSEAESRLRARPVSATQTKFPRVKWLSRAVSGRYTRGQHSTNTV